MNKSDFLNFYRSLLTIHFYDDVFIADDSIKVTTQTLPFEDFMDFYVLRTAKNNIPDLRRLEDKQDDVESKLIILKEALQNPKKWELDLEHRTIPPVENIYPIPVATDLDSGHTLILDSNHMLANWPYPPAMPIQLVRITGRELQRLVIDFIFAD